MPDSQLPPLWGPGYDERDLDALLSGRAGGTPAALRPVESTLAALRAEGTGRELAREAAARAAFRAFAPAAVTAHTLILPPADGRPRPAPRRRHRHRRPADSGARGPGLVVTGVAATALVAVAVAVTGALTGSIGRLASFGRQPASASAPARATTHSPGTQGPLVTGAARVTPSPSPRTTTASAPATPRPTSGPGSLCREYFEYPEHPVPGGAAAWFALGGQLSKLAGGPFKVYGYCLRYLDNPLAGQGGWPMIGPGADGPGESGRGDQGSGRVGPANVSPAGVSPANISPPMAAPASQENQGAGASDQGSATGGQGGGTGGQGGGAADAGRVSDPGAGLARP